MHPPSLHGEIEVRPIETWRDFLRLRHDWNAIAASDADACLLDHDWMAQSWKSVAGDGRGARPEILALRSGGAWTGFAALERHAGRLRRLAFLGDRHCQRCDLILARRDRAADAIAALALYLRKRTDWDICDLNRLRPPTAALIGRIWPAAGLPVRLRGQARQRVVRLDRSWSAVEGGFSPYVRANYDRRERRLRRRGALHLECWSERSQLLPRLEECFRLEASGWKGGRGTAILAQPGRRRFYRQLASRLALQGRFHLFRLLLDGRAIAFEYCLVHPSGSALHALKIGFDENLRTASPGLVLRWQLLQAVHGRIARYEFLGDDAPWKADWTPDTVHLCHMRAYNRTWRGRAVRLRSRIWRALRHACPLTVQ